MIRPKSEQAISAIVVCICVGFVVCVLYSLQAAVPGQFVAVVGVALAVAGAALTAGSLLGFLFGIPKTLQHDLPNASKPVTLQQDSPNAASQQTGGARQTAGEGPEFEANTSLEQISDWLTKILVGVGLTQLGGLPDALQQYATYVAPGLGNFASSEVFAIALLMYYLICGFLVTYLWTRLHLAPAFYQAHMESIGRKLERVEGKVSELEAQAGRDANALNSVLQQLRPAFDTPPKPQEQWDDAMKLTSPTVRDHIYDQVSRILSAYLDSPDTDGVVNLERSIPIYKALIANDTDESHPDYYGDLGVALHLQRKPKWEEALTMLTKAINLRGRWQEFGYTNWEFARAKCRIALDPNFALRKKSEPKATEEILADLKAAASEPSVGEFIDKNESMTEWLKVNGIARSSLAPGKAKAPKKQ